MSDKSSNASSDGDVSGGRRRGGSTSEGPLPSKSPRLIHGKENVADEPIEVSVPMIIVTETNPETTSDQLDRDTQHPSDHASCDDSLRNLSQNVDSKKEKKKSLLDEINLARRGSNDSLKGLKNVKNELDKQEGVTENTVTAMDTNAVANNDNNDPETQELKFKEGDRPRTPLPSFLQMMNQVSQLQNRRVKFQNSIEQILYEREGNPEEILTYLGFAGKDTVGGDHSRIPDRFLTGSSRASGITVAQFLENNPEVKEYFQMQLSANQPISVAPTEDSANQGQSSADKLTRHHVLNISSLQELYRYLANANVPEHYLASCAHHFKGLVDAHNRHKQSPLDPIAPCIASEESEPPAEQVATNNDEISPELDNTAVDRSGCTPDSLCSQSNRVDRPDCLELCDFGDEDGRLSWSTDTTTTPDPVYYYNASLSPGETIV